LAHRAGFAVSLPVILFILLLFGTFLLIPLSPMLSVTFKISRSTSYPYAPDIEFLASSYSKVSLWSTTSTTKGQISLNYLQAKQGQYDLSILISYGNEQLSAQEFNSLGEGTYQVQVVYLPRTGETPSVPYSLTFILLLNGMTITSWTITITPT